MKLTVVTPKLIAPPPSTFNIELTEEEFLALRSVVSRRDSSSHTILEPLRLQMWAVTRGKVSPFKVEKTESRLGTYHIRMKTTNELAGF